MGEMNLRFKAQLIKGWTLLEDRLIYGNREILLTEIQSVKVISKPSLCRNGVINIRVNGKIIALAYPNKSKEDGEKAILYLQENYGGEDQYEIKQRVLDIQAEISALNYKVEDEAIAEIQELPTVLGVDEHIKALTSGLIDKKTWLIVCTNKRVLMLDKGIIYGLELIDIPLDRINSISHCKGFLYGKISITDGTTTRTIENVPNITVSFFVDAVNKEMEIYKQSKTTPLTQVANTKSAADELIKYKQLLDMGALTQEEFNVKKKELLGL